MIDWLNSLVADVTTLLQGAATVGAIALVAYAYLKTRTLVALLVAAITAGIFLWTINNPEWWQERIGEETEVDTPSVPGEPP